MTIAKLKTYLNLDGNIFSLSFVASFFQQFYAKYWSVKSIKNFQQFFEMLNAYA